MGEGENSVHTLAQVLPLLVVLPIMTTVTGESRKSVYPTQETLRKLHLNEHCGGAGYRAGKEAKGNALDPAQEKVITVRQKLSGGRDTHAKNEPVSWMVDAVRQSARVWKRAVRKRTVSVPVQVREFKGAEGWGSSNAWIPATELRRTR